MAHIISHEGNKPRRKPIFVDPETDRPDPTRNPKGKKFSKLAKKAAAKAGKKKSAKKRSSKVAVPDKPLAEMSVSQLRAYAKAKGISLQGKRSKPDILAILGDSA
jgi:hypothetical protein